MSIYPITVKKESGRADSVSGGKEYHLVRISHGDEGRSIVINRWGKKGSWGVGFKVDRFQDMHDALVAYTDKWRDKLGKQYSDHFIDKTDVCGSEQSLRKALGPYFFKMRPEDLEWICPGIDTTGVKPQADAGGFQADEDGRGAWVDPKRRLVEEPKPIEEPIEARISENPNWGLF
jgi:predicted DNA-binding WGR domain protein